MYLDVFIPVLILTLCRVPYTRSTTEDDREVDLEVEVTEDDLIYMRTRRQSFDYNPLSPTGPNNWHNLSPRYCGRPRQSPININTFRVRYGRPYSIRYNNMGPVSGIMENNGHAPVFKIAQFNRNKVLQGVPGRPFDPYILDNIHIHFGSSNGGSEHLIDSRYFSGEIHLVHHNARFQTATDATGQPGGLAVIAIFFQVTNGPGGYSELDRLILSNNGMRNIINPKSTFPGNVNLRLLFPPNRNWAFYTYEGSKTTPNCAPNVRWIVLREPITISYWSMMVLRALRDITGVPISRFGNNRQPQPMDGRIVEANFI